MNVVRPAIARSSASKISCSVSLSIAAVGIVEQQDRRLEQHRARDREALALSAGESVAALAEDRVVALRQRHDEIVRGGDARRFLDLRRRRLGMAEGDVGRDGVGEKKALLENEADVAAQIVEVELAHVDAVDQHAARRSDRRSAESGSSARSCRRRSRRGWPRTGRAARRGRCRAPPARRRRRRRKRFRNAPRPSSFGRRTRIGRDSAPRPAHREFRKRAARRSAIAARCSRWWRRC